MKLSEVTADQAPKTMKLSEVTAQPSETSAPKDNVPSWLGNIMDAIAEPAAAVTTGMVAKPIADVAGLAALGKEVISPSGGDPQAFRKSVQEQLTYEPKTKFGKAGTKILGIPGKIVDYAAGGIENLIAGDKSQYAPVRQALGRGVREAVNQAPGIIGAKAAKSAIEALPEKQAALDIEKTLNAPKDMVRDAAQAANLITPVEGKSFIAGIPGMAKLNKWISAGDDKKVAQLVSEDVGLPKGAPLTSTELQAVRENNSGHYQIIKDEGNKLKSTVTEQPKFTLIDATGKPIELPPKTKTVSGFKMDPKFREEVGQQLDSISSLQSELPETFSSLNKAQDLLKEYMGKETVTGDAAVEAIKKLRKDASTNFKAADDPTKLATAFTQKSIADSLEGVVDRNLQRAGKGDLVDQMKSARRIYAKTYAIENALDADGKFNARKFAVANRNAPLDGNLKLVRDFALQYPEAVQKTSSGMQAISPWDWMFAVGSMAAKHPMVGAAEIAGRAGIPFAAQKGLLQTKTPSYVATPSLLKRAALPAGVLTTEGAEEDANQ